MLILLVERKSLGGRNWKGYWRYLVSVSSWIFLNFKKRRPVWRRKKAMVIQLVLHFTCSFQTCRNGWKEHGSLPCSVQEPPKAPGEGRGGREGVLLFFCVLTPSHIPGTGQVQQFIFTPGRSLSCWLWSVPGWWVWQCFHPRAPKQVNK